MTNTTFIKLELSDWNEFQSGRRTIKSIKDKDLYVEYMPVNLTFTTLEKKLGKDRYNCNKPTIFRDKEVYIQTTAREKRLKKNIAYDVPSKSKYGRSTRKSWSDKRNEKWNTNVNLYAGQLFIITEAYDKYCYVRLKSDVTSETVCMFYDELLIHKDILNYTV